MPEIRLKNGDMLTIPETPEELQEALVDDDFRAQVFGDASAENIQEFLKGYKKAVNAGDAIAKQTSEQLEATMMKFLKDNGISDLPSKGDIERLIPKNHPPKVAAQYNPYAPGASVEDIGFKGFGHLAQVVLRDRAQAAGEANLGAEDLKLYNDLKKITAAYSSSNPESAGFLIPESTRAEILSQSIEMSVVRPNATVINMSTKAVDVPYVDVSSHASSLFGGMIWYWTEESGTILSTEAKFGKVRLEANKLTGGARIPNELLADVPALGSFLDSKLPQGLAWFEDDAFIRGSGVGEPEGFLNSSAIVQYDRGTTDTIVPADLAGMYARMLPQSLGTAAWLVNQTALPQLFTLTLSDHAAGLVTGGDFTGGPTLSILGRPVIVTEKMPALANGAGNEIMFVDLAYYLIGDRQAISIDSSPHSRFMQDETELRVIHRVDGRPWIQSALTPAQGSTTLSPFVGLTDA